MDNHGVVHIGRQAVFTAVGEVAGYELRFRSLIAPTDDQDGGEVSRLIVSTFAEFSLDQLVGDTIAFVNVTTPFLTGMMPLPFAPGKVVLEIPTYVRRDEIALDGIATLRSEGHVISVDVPDGFLEADPFLNYANYARVDIKRYEVNALKSIVATLAARGIEVLARGVDDAELANVADAAGVSLRAGNVYAGVDVVSAKSMSPGRMAALRLVRRLSDPALQLEEVESIVKTDASLTYRLLRAANSASSGSSRKINSLRDAVIMLGMRQLRAWLLLLLVGDGTAVGTEQLSSAITRARTCELLAHQVGVRADEAFIGGLLSSLSPVVGLEPGDMCREMGLDGHLTAAIVEGAGPLGELIHDVAAYEAADISSWASNQQFDIGRAWLMAVGWSVQTVGGVRDTADAV